MRMSSLSAAAATLPKGVAKRNETPRTSGPKEWITTNLQDATEIVAGFAFPSGKYRTSPSDSRLLRGVTVGPQTLDWSEPLYWERIVGDGLEKYQLEPGDLVIAMDRPWIAAGFRLAQVTSNDLPALLVQRVARLRPKRGFDSGFLYHLLCSGGLLRHLQQRQTETTVPHVSHRDIASFEFSAPPLPEQKRIAAILDKADAIRRKRQQAIELTENLLRSAFLEMFGDPLRGSVRDARLTTLGKLVDVKGGKRLPKGATYSAALTPHPYIRVVDIENGTVRTDKLRYLTPEVQRRIARYTISSEDVLISIAGTIGLVATIPRELSGANLTENSAKLVIRDKSTLHRDYLESYLSSVAQEEIARRTMSTGQPKLALFRIEEIPIPIPPMDRQVRFANIAARSRALARKMSESGDADRLTESLTQAAFSGRL